MKTLANIKIKIARMGLRQKTVTFAMIFFLSTVLISGITFYAVYGEMKQRAIDKTLENFSMQKKTEIEDYFNNLETMAYEIGFSSWMQVLFERSTLDSRTIQELAESVEYYMGSISEMNGDILIAAIMEDGRRMNGPDGNYLDYSVQIEDKDWYATFLKEGKYIEVGNGKGIYTRDMGWYMNIYYPINNRYSMEQEGILVITLLQDNVDKFVELEIPGEYVVLMDESGERISSGISGELEERIKQSKSAYKTIEETVNIGGREWTIRSILDTGNLRIENKEIWIGFAVAIILITFLFAAGALLFSEYLTKPILKCKEYMIKIRNNHMGVYIENQYHDELGELINGFNEMSASIAG